MLLVACVCPAQEEPAAPAADDTELIDRRPFDQIVLNAANESAVLDVFPLEFPNRQVPSPFPGGKLQVRLLDRPAQLFDVLWSDVAEIRLYEAMLLAEANKLTGQRKFDDAFDYFSTLIEQHPELPGLNPAVERYLQQDALATFKAEQFDRALAVLQSLYERNPTFAGLDKAIDGVGGKIIEEQLAAGQFASARSTLESLARQFPELKLQTVAIWRQRFAAAASKKVNEAQSLVSQRQFAEARRAIQQALAIWPEADGATQLLANIDTAYPIISVGVTESAPRNLAARIDSWPALRCSRLVERSLTELVDYESQGGGGIYASPLGVLSQDDAGTTLTLQVDRQQLDTDAVGLVAASVARMLVKSPGPSDADEVGAPLSAIWLEFPNTVHMKLASQHVRPEALLQLPLTDDVSRYLADPEFQVTFREENVQRFECPGEPIATSAPTIRSVEEITYPDDEAAIAALMRGEVDIVDRVPPWQLAKLQNRNDIQLAKYRLPTVHALIPNPRVPLATQREFRRALAYGINREQILNEIILGGKPLPDFQTLSGPFPAGFSQGDVVRYAYNSQIQPRAYDPRLAALLATVAWNSLNKKQAEPQSAEESGEEPPKLPPLPTLRLAHTADPIARTACQTIKLQLDAIGIPIELVEMPVEDLTDDNYDLRYAELAVWEPLIDADRVLGLDGVAGTSTDYMVAALRQLDAATTWNQVKASLYAIHELAHSDLSVIPLWQTVNYFAYRRDFQGMPESPVVLYQNVNDWQRVVGTAQAR